MSAVPCSVTYAVASSKDVYSRASSSPLGCVRFANHASCRCSTGHMDAAKAASPELSKTMRSA